MHFSDMPRRRMIGMVAGLAAAPLFITAPVPAREDNGREKRLVPVTVLVAPEPSPQDDPPLRREGSVMEPPLADPLDDSSVGPSVGLSDSLQTPPAVQNESSQTAPVHHCTSCTSCSCTLCTNEKQQAALTAMKGAYQEVFYDNDFDYLNDPCYRGPSFLGDSLKGMLGGKLDVGGEIRVRYHNERNHRGLGLTGVDDNFWLTRYRNYADLRINEYFRFYGEYLYADSGGEDFASRPIEENRGEAQNLFLDAKLIDGPAGNLTARVGRQELVYGTQRLVSPLDWANTRRTFDGYRMLYNTGDWSIDGFYVNPVQRTAAYEDRWDSTDEQVDFYGLYASKKNASGGVVEWYYLGLEDQRSDFDYHTFGSRVAGKRDSGLLYEMEAGYQFGNNSPGYGDHDAAFVTVGAGRKLAAGNWQPTLWLWYDWASGGDTVPTARGDDSFDHLFPLSHKYLGFMDLFGRRNINDANAQLTMPLGSKISLLLWYHYLFLDEKTSPYNVTLTPFNGNNRAGDRELGHEIDVLLSITMNPRHSALLGYSHFNSGDYYSTTLGAQDIDADFIYAQYQMRF